MVGVRADSVVAHGLRSEVVRSELLNEESTTGSLEACSVLCTSIRAANFFNQILIDFLLSLSKPSR